MGSHGYGGWPVLKLQHESMRGKSRRANSIEPEQSMVYFQSKGWQTRDSGRVDASVQVLRQEKSQHPGSNTIREKGLFLTLKRVRLLFLFRSSTI